MAFGAILLAAVLVAGADQASGAVVIPREDVERVNPLPGIDRTIAVVDIGHEHFAIGVIHRGVMHRPTTVPASTLSRPLQAGQERCGARGPVIGPLVPGLTHESQTEGYYIVSGEGVLTLGGQIVDGRTELPDSEVVVALNGPSCRGGIGGAGVEEHRVRAGDIIIVPAGVPHGWAEVADHVDYVSFRPSRNILAAGYRNPALHHTAPATAGQNERSARQ